MSYSTNNNSKIMYGEETVYNTAVTPTKYFGIVQNFNFNETNGILKTKSIDSRRTKILSYGPYSVSGTINSQVIDWSLLKYALGSVSGTSTLNYPDVSTSFDTGILTLPSITIEGVSDDNQGSKITGCKCSSCNINIAEGQIVTMETGWTGSKAFNITSLTGSYTSPTNVPLTYIQGVFERSGSSIGVVKSVSIGITNAFNLIKGINGRFIIDIIPGAFDVTMDTTVIMSTDLASTLIADFYGQTASSGPVDGTGAVSDTSYTLTFNKGESNEDVITLVGTIESIGRVMDVGNNNRSMSIKYDLKTINVSEKIP